MDVEFLNTRITRTKADIEAYEDAITAIVGGVASYKLDTGQDSQTVTQHNLSSLQKQLDALYDRLDTLQTRLNGDGTIVAQPGF